MSWPGGTFHLVNGIDWVCSICQTVANHKPGVGCVRKSVRGYHTIARCARGLRLKSVEDQELAMGRAESKGSDFFVLFQGEMNLGRARSPPVLDRVSREDYNSPSPSPSTRKRKHKPNIAIDEYVNHRVAKIFEGSVFFGTVVERLPRPVLAKEANETRVWQVVWKIQYDDGDAEELTRLEIVKTMKLYRRYEKDDKKLQSVVSVDNLGSTADVNHEQGEGVDDDNIINEGLPSTVTDFLDPRYCLLDLLTPTATQNKLSYLVELVLDKSKKGISNEALKHRLRKDTAAFGAENMPTDIRSIARFLGARTLDDGVRHIFGNKDCSYAWIGTVNMSGVDFTECCPDCGTTRYKDVGGKYKPRRRFYYFGAAQAIEGLHRHPVFRKYWKNNLDVSLNAYRSSPDAKRLDKATGGEALAAHNGLYVSMADGFQSHNSKTQSITGIITLAVLIANRSYN